MKKKVKQYGRQIEVGSLDRRHVLKDFSRMLDHQVFLLFFFLHRISLVKSYVSNSIKTCFQMHADRENLSFHVGAARFAFK